MIIKSFGCSFIFGTDLADNDCNKYSQLTWPALLAQDKNMQYQCYARPGSGNLRILEKVLSFSTQKPAVFIIGWSWIDRFDYIVDRPQKYHLHDLANNNSMWETIMPIDNCRTSRVYYKDLHSQYCDKLTTLVYIKTAIDTLNQKNIPFIMTYIDELLFEDQCHSNPAVIDLQNYIRPHMTAFDEKTFLNFSKANGYPTSDTMHPLESAHRAAFELIKSYNLL